MDDIFIEPCKDDPSKLAHWELHGQEILNKKILCKRGHEITFKNPWHENCNGMLSKVNCKQCTLDNIKIWKRIKRNGENKRVRSNNNDLYFVKCGHERFGKNIYYSGKNRSCITCKICYTISRTKMRRNKGEKPQVICKDNSERKNRNRMSRLRREMNKRRNFVEYIDPLILFKRDNGICYLCDKFVFMNNFHVDHIIPLSKGGEHSYKNTAITHPICNKKKYTNITNKIPIFLRKRNIKISE